MEDPVDPLLLTPAEIERRVYLWLQGRPPATPEDWRRLGPEGHKRLLGVAVTAREGARANKLRGAALVVLGQMGDERHMDAILEVFDDPTVPVVVRCGAIEALGYMGRLRSLPLLQSQAFHSDFKVRLFAVSALARIPGALSRRIIADVAMRDPIQQVRRSAQAELERLDRKAAEARSPVKTSRDAPCTTLEEEIEAPGVSLSPGGNTMPSPTADATDPWPAARISACG